MNPVVALTLKFPVNQWQHLYSLAKAIQHDENLAAEKLIIHGETTNPALLNGKRKQLELCFYPVTNIPAYQRLDDGNIIVGQLSLQQEPLLAQLAVSQPVFDEMVKNLREYADIEGIHIMVKITLRADTGDTSTMDTIDILDVEYAMRGDA